jgi:hypothetical protein
VLKNYSDISCIIDIKHFLSNESVAFLNNIIFRLNAIYANVPAIISGPLGEMNDQSMIVDSHLQSTTEESKVISKCEDKSTDKTCFAKQYFRNYH